MFDTNSLDRKGIIPINLQTRLRDNKVMLHNIQLVQESPTVIDFLRMLRSKSKEDYYLPTLTLEYVYNSLFDDNQRMFYDKLLEEEEEFIVYFTDTENHLYYFLSSENYVRRDTSRFDFRKKFEDKKNAIA